MKYNCHCCNEENEAINFGENKCSLCSETNIILNPQQYENIRFSLENKMQHISDQINANSKESWEDSHSVRKAKDRAVSIYREALCTLKFIVDENNIKVNVDYDSIKSLPDILRPCQMNHNKVCTHCGDC